MIVEAIVERHGLTKGKRYDTLSGNVKPNCYKIETDNGTISNRNKKWFKVVDESSGENNKEENKLSIDTDNKSEKFTWDIKREDPELYKYGRRILIIRGRAKAIQKFVEALSYKINSKCDFGYTAGYAHIDCHENAVKAAREAIYDDGFMEEFVVAYSEASYHSETYFEIKDYLI